MRKLLVTLATLALFSSSLLADMTIVTSDSYDGTFGPTRDVTDPPDFIDIAVNPGDVVTIVTATNKPYANAVISYASNAPTSEDGQFNTSGLIEADGFQTYLGYFMIDPSVAPGATHTFEVNRSAGADSDDNITLSTAMFVLRATSGEIDFLGTAGNEWQGLGGATTYTFDDAISWTENTNHGQVIAIGGGSSRRGNLVPINDTLTLENTNGGDLTGVLRLNGFKAPAAASSTGYTVNWELVNQDDAENGSTLSAAFAEIVGAVTPTYAVGGNVSGLTGSGLVLQNNGGDDLTVTSDGAFTFATRLDDGAAYDVTVSAQPTGQQCTVSDGSGTIAGADVTNIAVTCADIPTYAVGGTLTGLDGSVTLQNNGGDDLTLTADGAFAFATMLPEGAAYAVTVSAQPATQTCAVTDGSGTVGAADVTSIAVTCTTVQKYSVGGTVSGLGGDGLVLQNNGGDDLAVSADGAFTFATTLEDGAAYAVTVSAQPAGQTCTVADGSGTIAGADVTGVAVTCEDIPTYAIGGTLTGLDGSVTLQNNGGDDLTLTADGAFAFATELLDGEAYAVTITAQPDGQECTVTDGSGTVAGADVTSVQVSCTDITSYAVGGTVSGLDGSVTLQNNGGDDLTIDADGDFAFATEVDDGQSYAVTVLSQPADQECTVANGSGTIAGAAVTNVTVTCVDVVTYTVGGTVSGVFIGAGSVILQNNGGDDLVVKPDGPYPYPFTFPTGLQPGDTYDVTVARDAGGMNCAVVFGGSGSIGMSDITDVEVECVGAAKEPPTEGIPTLSRLGLLILALTIGLVAFGYRRYF